MSLFSGKCNIFRLQISIMITVNYQECAPFNPSLTLKKLTILSWNGGWNFSFLWISFVSCPVIFQPIPSWNGRWNQKQQELNLLYVAIFQPIPSWNGHWNFCVVLLFSSGDRGFQPIPSWNGHWNLIILTLDATLGDSFNPSLVGMVIETALAATSV